LVSTSSTTWTARGDTELLATTTASETGQSPPTDSENDTVRTSLAVESPHPLRAAKIATRNGRGNAFMKSSIPQHTLARGELGKGRVLRGAASLLRERSDPLSNEYAQARKTWS
jgi:hypothetical protein